MRKIILFIASSLDGFIARKDSSIDWLFNDADYGYKSFYASIDTVLLGRKTYEKALQLEQHPFQGKSCYVFSRQKNIPLAGAARLVGEPIPFTQKLLCQRGKDIWLVGGGEIAALFLGHRLLDELILSIHPRILGEGIRLLPALKKEVPLKLANTFSFPSGLVQLHYTVLK